MHKRNKFISLGLSFILAAMPYHLWRQLNFQTVQLTHLIQNLRMEQKVMWKMIPEITAEEPSDEGASFKESMIPDADDTTDNEKLLEEYLNSISSMNRICLHSLELLWQRVC